MSELETRKGMVPASERIAEVYEQGRDALIMMVDDEPIMMDLVEAFLEEEGYHNFVKVEHSVEAIERIELEKPDILLLDLNMPEVNGFDILRALRDSDIANHTPVIILTSSTDPDCKLRALELGATDFLAKPVDASELTLRMRNTLAAKAYQDRLEYYDTLTGLPNRKLFLDRLAWTLTRDMREERGVVVMNIGLDRFKQINDSLGPKVGDQLLVAVAERLTESVRQSDVVSRIGHDQLWSNLSRLAGDEFSLLFPGVKNSEDCSYIAKRILAALESPFVIGGESIYLTASIGIANGPADGVESDALIKHASTAAAHAKQQGGNSYQFFARELNEQTKTRLQLENDLRTALENDEFELHYQPKIDAFNNDVVGVEALLRWRHPERGMIPPCEYIELAEETGLIVPIGEWVLQEACRQNMAWQALGLKPFKVSVNVSVKQLQQHKLREVVERSLTESGMEPGLLILEITEGQVMEDIENKLKILHEIRDIGVSFSIDDFGTGYSSLAYLRDLPISEFKIDRSFLLNLPANKQDGAIVRAIIALAQTLELDLVAEGVEEREQLDYLLSRGCRVIQGFYFSKPLPAAELVAYVKQVGLQRSA